MFAYSRVYPPGKMLLAHRDDNQNQRRDANQDDDQVPVTQSTRREIRLRPASKSRTRWTERPVRVKTPSLPRCLATMPSPGAVIVRRWPVPTAERPAAARPLYVDDTASGKVALERAQTFPLRSSGRRVAY
jgi:hypothetical protein